MIFAPENIFYIHNRGNNNQRIFFQERNYDFFLKKALLELHLHMHFLTYCLLPNHFSFMIYTKPKTLSYKISDSFRTLLSSYTRAIHKQERTTGSLFQQNTKAKEIVSDAHALTCLHHIHQIPMREGLVQKIEAWPHHSFNEYWKKEPGICNVEFGKNLLTIPFDADQFYRESYEVILDESQC